MDNELVLGDVLIFILENLKSNKPEEKVYLDILKRLRGLDNMLDPMV